MKQRQLLASYFTIAGNVHPATNNVPSEHDFRTRVETAARAGFRGIGLFSNDLAFVVKKYGYPTIRKILADNGMQWVEVECLFDWFSSGQSREASNRVRAFLLEAAAELGAFQMKVVSDLSGDCPQDQMIEDFALLCDDAARAGTKVGLELTPFSNTPNLQSALAIIDGAGRLNGGLMLDIWHVARGGIEFNAIAALPKRYIFGVELNDALLEVQGTLIEDTLERRLFCGEGEFDVAGFIDALDEAGFDGPFGIEVLSDKVRSMTLEDAAQQSFETTARVFGRSKNPIIL